jgi:hypothetical protein
MIVDHAAVGRSGNDTTSDAVCRARNIEQYFWNRTQGGAPGDLREFRGKLVGSGNIARHLVPAADQHFAERPEPRAFPAHLDMPLDGLHAKENHVLSRPTPRPQQTHGFDRVEQQGAKEILEPKPDALSTWPAIGHHRG